MVLFEFVLYARTQNVQSISMPTQGEWHCKIKCCACNQQFPKEVILSTTEHIEVIKEQVNFMAKCKNCQRKGTINITSNSSYIVHANEDGLIKESIAEIECRGIEVLSVNMGNSFTVHSKSSTSYEEADFTYKYFICRDDLWAQYDEGLSELCQVEQAKIMINRK